MPYVRVINGVALDPVEINPVGLFTSEIAAQFEYLDVPGLRHGAQLVEGEWINPPEPEPPPIQSPRNITVQAFRSRFTDAELKWMLALARNGNDDAGLLLLKFQTRTEVDLDDPAVVAGMGYLVSVQGSLITADRVAEILG